MKLSHFALSLLAVCAVQAEIILPTGFERIDVTTGTDFKADGSWSFGDNSYVFVLGDDTAWVTSASQNTPMRDGAVYITSDSVAPASFSATGLTNGRILQATAIEGVTKGKTYTWSGLDDVSISQNSVNRNVSISNGTLTSRKYIFGVIGGSHVSQIFSFSNNGAVNISGNYAAGEVEARGGAIYTSSGVFIENNESVILAGNYEKSIDAATGAAAYRLRSIYQDNTTTDNSLLADSQFRLMAAKDKVIDIQDSVYSNYKGIDVVFNGDYAASAGGTVKGEGTIRFTGQHTREALEKLKGEGAVTDEELAASRTSEFASIVKLMGGRLELVEAVCLKGVGVNVAEGSGAVLALENGSTLQQTGAVTFNAGTTLEVTGTSNTLTAQSLTLADDSTMKFVLTHDALSSAMLTLDVTDGLSADFFNNVTIELAGELTAETGTYHLLSARRRRK